MMERQGRATELSWRLKRIAAAWAIAAGSILVIMNNVSIESATFVLIITSAIIAPGIPIDISKIKQSTDGSK